MSTIRFTGQDTTCKYAPLPIEYQKVAAIDLLFHVFQLYTQSLNAAPSKHNGEGQSLQRSEFSELFWRSCKNVDLRSERVSTHRAPRRNPIALQMHMLPSVSSSANLCGRITITGKNTVASASSEMPACLCELFCLLGKAMSYQQW